MKPITPLALFLLLTAAHAHSRSIRGCTAPNSQIQSNLPVKDGFVDFMRPSDLAPLKAALPKVDNSAIQALIDSPDTMWYDEDSIVFGYQDSVGDVTGFRANCVGRSVGEDPPTSSVGKLKNYFGPDFRFVFPFRKVAGSDQVPTMKVINFWAPPKSGGRVLPVKVWKSGYRGHYYWTFPNNTVIGEVLYLPSPEGKWYVFEIRTRKRYADGWGVDAFRPFPTAKSLADRIAKLRPDWQLSINLSEVMDFLTNKNTLQAQQWTSPAFAKIFPAINGALDYLPAINEKKLVTELLTTTVFTSSEGAVWKSNGALETYAPSTKSEYSIVPKNYEGGMLAVNEVSCNRCHTEVSRAIAEFDFDVSAYGEVWGEDRIFTWHPFEPTREIYNTFDESDTPSTRRLNPRLLQANLIINEQPGSGDINYKSLPSVFKKPFERVGRY